MKNKEKEEFKQVIIVREDLKMSKGKIAAQVSHGSVDAVLKTDKEDVIKWHNNGMKKVVLKVKDKQELLDFKKKAQTAGLTCSLVIDAGHTEIPSGTPTCLAIGPDKEQKIDKITGKLKLL